MSVSKVLVVGAVLGQFSKAIQKISKLHLKQNFSFAIVVGDLFASEDTDETRADLASLRSGTIQVPLPTYFTVGDFAVPDVVREDIENNGELCANLFYLGRKGTLKTSEDVRIVNIGGRSVQNPESLTQGLTNYDPLFIETDANTLRGANSADILITNQWPSRIDTNSNTPLPDGIDTKSGSESLARLCAALKPRYHFSSSPEPASKWEREPFLHPKSYEETEQSTDVTRFVSLASVNASAKDWMYAFTLDLGKPPNTDGAQVISPLILLTKRKRAPENNGFSRYDTTSTKSPHHHKSKRGRHGQAQEQSACFMCMGLPSFNTGMVVSISDESFITVLKGPLPTPTTFPQLQSAGHNMIIPMYHAALETSSSKRTTLELETEFTDMTRYRTHLNRMMSKHHLGSVCWEVNRTGIRHLHWQHIACPTEAIRKGLVEAAYKVSAEKSQYPPFQPCKPTELIPGQRADYFRVWIFDPSTSTTSTTTTTSPTNGKPQHSSPIETADALSNGNDDPTDTDTDTGTEKSLYFPIPADLKFNISFGREVMAGLLQLEHRTDWRSIPAGDEDSDAENMKADFGPFDPAM